MKDKIVTVKASTIKLTSKEKIVQLAIDRGEEENVGNAIKQLRELNKKPAQGK